MKGVWRQENNTLIVDAEVIDIIIPSEYFDEPTLSEDYGTEVNTFCFLTVRTWKNGKIHKVGSFQLPGRLTFTYAEKFIEKSEGYAMLDGDDIVEIATPLDDDQKTDVDISDKVEDIKASKIDDDTIEDQAMVGTEPSVMDSAKLTEDDDDNSNTYFVFRNFENNILVHKAFIVQSVDNMYELSKSISSGKLANIDYRALPLLYIKAAKLNKVNAGITNSLNEIMISEMVRWKKDHTVPLRLAIAKGQATEEDGILCKLKDLPRLNSVLTGIGFENIVLSSQIAVAKTNTNSKQRVSPVEEVINY